MTAISRDAQKISVITATYNAAAILPSLIQSLQNQTDKDFEWIVADGGSTDGTLELLASVEDIDISVISEPDFGIYDALNRGVRASSSDYYVVAGADDTFYSDAIQHFKQNISPEIDIVAANIEANGHVIRPGRGAAWLYGQFEFVAGHSIGTLFRRNLHQTYGFYSRHFPIAADQLFIKKCCQDQARLKLADFTAGRYGSNGVSSVDIAGSLSESFRVQLLTEKYKLPQFLIYCLRLIKNYSRL